MALKVVGAASDRHDMKRAGAMGMALLAAACASGSENAASPAPQADVWHVTRLDTNDRSDDFGPSTFGRNEARFRQVLDVAASGELFVAVGEEVSRDRDPDWRPAEPLMWTTDRPDGPWHAQAVPEGIATVAVAAPGSGGVVVAGSTLDGAVYVMGSGDGDRWWIDRVDPGGGAVQGVVSVADQPVLVGSTYGESGPEPAIWVEGDDGWARTDLDDPGGAAELRGICVDGDRVVAVGVVDVGASQWPLLYRSGDGGATWQRLDTFRFDETQPSLRANGCAVNGDDIVVIGTESQEHDRATVLRSPDDGASWELASLVQFGDVPTHTLGRSVIHVAGGWVAVGYDSTGDSDGDLAVWGSSDGRTWHVDLEPREVADGPGVGEARAVIATDAGLLAVGTMADRAVAWDGPIRLVDGPVVGEAAFRPPGGFVPPSFAERTAGIDACSLLEPWLVSQMLLEDASRIVPVGRDVLGPEGIGCTWFGATTSLTMYLVPPTHPLASTDTGRSPPRQDDCGGETLILAVSYVREQCEDVVVIVDREGFGDLLDVPNMYETLYYALRGLGFPIV